MFVAPLHMLQMYDRVLISRSEVTLIALTGLAIGMLVIYGLLEGIRSRILVRIGLQFDELVSSKLFNMIFETQILRPKLPGTQAFRDIDTIREFISGNAIISLCDAPWVPIFIGACFILHPILGSVALGGAVCVFVLAAVNEWMNTCTSNRVSAGQVPYFSLPGHASLAPVSVSRIPKTACQGKHLVPFPC